MDCGVPGETSYWLLQTIFGRLSYVRYESIDILDLSNNPAPAAAAAAFIPSLLNGATGMRLPDHSSWVAMYKRDPETKILLSFAKDPSLDTEPEVQELH